ncbi:MAG: hypothetical protein VW894_02465 [Gammaproteobacteria bacterium]
MAEETNQAEETVQETVEQQVQDTSTDTQVDAKVDLSSSPQIEDDGVIKVDLRQQPQTEEKNAVQEQSTDEVPVRDESETSGEVQQQNIEKTDEKSTGESDTSDDEMPVVELVEDEEKIEESQTLADKIKDIPNKLKEEVEDVNNNQETSQLPENINKLVEFMQETGGTLEDYVNLNKDYDGMEDMDILREHYRQTKPHLSQDEISFLIEDSFSYDEEVDDERDIKRKKLALKESIAEAKSNLTSLKSKYYNDLKLSSKLTPEQKEAVEFYNTYKQEQNQSQQIAQQQRSVFEQKTNELFSENFKGFEYKVGDKKYRFNVKDINNVKDSQADINSLVSRFVNENNEMSDAAGYHKALFTAMNADSIANHFYEQGRADAIKNQMAKSKNVDMNPRGTHEAVTTDSGFKIRAISGDDSSKLRIKLRQ